MKTKRLMLLCPNSSRGGVANVVEQLARGVRRTGGWTTCIASDHGSMEPTLRAAADEFRVVPFASGLRGFWGAFRALRRAMREYRPDVVHSHSRWPSMVAIAAGRRPEVSTQHLDQLTNHGSALDSGLVRRWFSGWGRAVLTLDESAREMLVRECGLDPARVTVVPNGVSGERVWPASPIERDAARRGLGVGREELALLFVGRLTSVKRVGWCIDALAAAGAAGLNAKLLIIGDGPEQSVLREYAAKRGVSDRIVWTGWLAAPHRAYHAADLLLLPSSSEGFPLVCSESMLCGVPVVRTRCGGWQSHTVNERAGWAVDTGDCNAFVTTVVGALKDTREREARAAFALEFARQHLTEARWLESTISVYDGFLGTERTGALA